LFLTCYDKGVDDCLGFVDERTLLTALCNHDAAAFEYLVRTYHRRLLAVARRLLGCEEDAQDAVQNAFLAAFRAIGTFEGGAQLSTWLHRIVINAALMILRTKRRRPEQLHDPFALELLQDHQLSTAIETMQSSSPESLLLRQEICTLVRSSLACLSTQARGVLLLKEIEGLNTQESAHHLGVSPNAAKIRLCRARKLFRRIFLSRLQDK
jgi:RNA polymerase sigma-70 factor, ECF subfamily